MLTSGPQKKHTLFAVEFLYEAEFLMAALRSRSPAAQPGQGCRPGGAARLRLTAPPPRPAVAAPARHRRAGSWGSPGRRIYPTPARPRAPRPPAAAGPRKRLRPCKKAVYCILCSRRRPLPAALAAGKRSARSPRRRNRAQ